MARMTPDEWRKKKEEEEKEQSKTPSLGQLLKKYAASNTDSTTNTLPEINVKSSRRMTAYEWKVKNSTATALDWALSAETLLNDTEDSFSTWRNADDEDYIALEERRQNLLSHANYWRKMYADNDEATVEIENVVSCLQEIGNMSSKGLEYYSKWDTAEAYQKDLREYDYLQKYKDLTYKDIQSNLGQMEDGEEKEWLTAYGEYVDQNDKLTLDRDVALTEIFQLKKLYQNARDAKPIYDAYTQQPESYSNPRVKEKVDIYNKMLEEYGSLETLEDLVEEKRKYLDESDKLKKHAALHSVGDPNSPYYDPDFEKYTGYVSNVEYNFFGVPEFTDKTYAWINNPTVDDKRWGGDTISARAEIESDLAAFTWDTPNRNRESQWYRKHYDFLTEDEIAIYNYHYAINGKQKANEYLSSLSEVLEARANFDTVESSTKFAKEHPGWAYATSFAFKLGSAFEYIDDAVSYASDSIMGDGEARMDTNEYALTADTIRATVGENLEWEIAGWDAGSFLYNTFTSGVDSYISAKLLGPLAGVSLGLSAAASGTNDALNRGMSNGKAFWTGFFNGVFEGLFESISLGKLNSLKEVPPDTIKDIMKNLGKSMLVNASEEALTELANIGYDTLVNGEFANYTWEELKAGAWKDAVWQVVESGGSGALMGIGLSGAGNTAGYIEGKKATANELYGDNQGALVQKVLEVNPGNKFAQKMQSKLDNGKDLSLGQLGKLFRKNENALSSQDMQTIQSATESRLTELGETGNVTGIAAALTKQVAGKRLSKSEQQLITESKYGQRVANELNADNIESGEYASAWAEKIGTNVINAQEYSRLLEAAQLPQETTETTDGKIDTDEMNEAKAIKGEASPATKPGTRMVDANEATATTTESRTVDTADVTTANPEARKVDSTEATDQESLQIAEDGVTRQVSTNQAITPQKIVSLDGGKVMVQTDQGTIAADDIFFGTEETDLLWRGTTSINGINTSGANGIIRAYQSGTPVATYLGGAAQEFKNGYYGMESGGKYADKLTPGQRNIIYDLGQKAAGESIAKAQAALKESAAKSSGESKNGSGKAKKSGNVHFERNGRTFDAKRETALKTMDQLSKALGVNFHVYESYVNDAGQRVYKDARGNEVKAPNGYYDPATGKIYIDLNAGNTGNGIMLFTVAHELAHFIKDWSPAKYKVLANFLMKSYGKSGISVNRLVEDQLRKAQNNGRKLSWDEAYDEVVADSMEGMLSDGNVVQKMAELKQLDKTLWQKVCDWFKNLANDLKALVAAYKDVKPDSPEGKMVSQMHDMIGVLESLYTEALVDAGENYQAAMDIEVDANTESVSPSVLSSERTWTESEYVQQRDQAANEIAKAIGVSKNKAKAYIDSVNSIAKMIAEDRVRLDYFSSPNRSSFVSNVEYGGSFDFSTLCKKRRLLTGTFTAIQKALPNTALTANEILDIRNRMKDKGLEVSCGLCYVEGSRANMGQFAKEFLNLYKKYYPDAWQPNMADVNTPEGIEWVRINHPECYEQYEYFWNHYGTLKPGDKNLFASQQKPKLYQLHTEYKGEILEKFNDDENVEAKNLNGGIRLQSFSDFEIVHLIDTMQIIMDMSRVGLAGQAYTKVPDFAWALGDTGLKINLSLIAKGVDNNGQLIFDDVEGMPIDKAVELRNRYSKNVGTILVAFNDGQLLAAMADDRVDFIIPFHRSQWKKSQYEAMGLPANTKDYTYMQNEKFIKPQYHEYRGRMVSDKATNYMPNEYWDFSKSGKENAEAYLEMCARNNKRPKFYKLLQNNGDGSYSLKADGSTDGYWKLLIDFKMYDNNGNGSPQMPVKPEFNMDEAQRMLNDYKGGHSNFPVAQGVVDSFVQEYKDSHKGAKFSDRDNAPTFYSHMAKVVDAVKQEKLGASSVVNMLRGKGVKADEIKWSGIEAWLEGKKSVAKAELQEFIAGSMLQIDEQVRDKKKPRNLKVKDLPNGEKGLYADGKLVETFTVDENGYLYPSNEEDKGIGYSNAKQILEYYDSSGVNTKWSEYKLDGGKNYREIVFKLPNSTYSNASMQVHWGIDAKGILAHARLQDFKVNGKKMLFIEEIQSDWHNAGHRAGYITESKEKTTADIRNESADAFHEFYNSDVISSIENRLARSGYADTVRLIEDLFDGKQYAYSIVVEQIGALTSNEKSFIENAAKEEAKRQANLETAPDPSKGTVPDAPFRDNYHEFVLKRLIREAAEKGYGSIGWTTADIQSERWSEMYAEGYRIEYDQDMPKFLKKYGKQWGAEVSTTTLKNGTEVWSMDITPAMKESVMTKGQALYSDRDSSYLDAVNRGDMETAQKMVDEAAKAAGYTTSGYHGSRTPGFTVVDKYSWLWLARDEAVANGYGTHDEVDSIGKPFNNKGVYAMRYNLGNNLQIYADGASWGELPVTEDEYPGVYVDEYNGYITTNAMAEWAEGNGYDSITFVDVDDGGLTTVDVIFNPNRDAKSADPVTYDDKGEVIPLSRRFDQKHDDLRYSSREADSNVGYHAGDLGKSESLRQQGLGRDTGHFGTGTYFVGNKVALDGYNSRGGKPAPVESVDFTKYNLFKPKNAQDGLALHDFLRGVDGYWNRDADAVNTMEEYESLQGKLNELVYDIESEEFGETDPSKESWMAVEKEFLFDAKRMMGGYQVGKALTDTLNRLVDGNYQYDHRSDEYYSYDFETDQFTSYTEDEIIQKLNAEEGGWKAFEGIEKLADDYYSYSRTSRYETWTESIKDIAKVLGISEQEVRNVFQSVTEDIASRDYTDADMETADSAATRFMKALGYEGIDVRGIKGLDNTSYGSVIYDLKGEDLARKKAIGTARYSYRDTGLDSNGNQLSAEQQEYFENSAVRDRNGNLLAVYHGGTVEYEFDTERGSKGDTQYGRGSYFTDSEYYAKEYTYYRGGNVQTFYLNIEKLFDDTNMDLTTQSEEWNKLVDILRKNGIEDKFINKFGENGFAYMSRYLAIQSGSKAVGSWEKADMLNAMIREAGFQGIKGDINDASQYVIFNPNQAKLTTNKSPSSSNDTRFSERDPELEKVNRVLEKENAQLKEDISSLKELLELQGKLTHGTKFTKTSVEAAARQLIKYADANGNAKELAGLLNGVYEYIAGSRELTWDGIKDVAEPAVTWLQNNLRDMSELDAYGYDHELFRQELLSQVYDSYWNVSTLYTVKDLAQKKIDKLKFDHSRRMAELKKYHKEQTEQLKAEHREDLKKVRQAERDRSEKKMKEISERYQESRKKNAENHKKTEMRRKIRKTVMDLNKLLSHGDKKRNVKEEMKGFVSKALELADYLFTDHISNDDLIRRGITVRMTAKEAVLVKDTEEILSQLYDHADSLTDEEFMRLDSKRKRNMEKLRDILTAQRNDRLQTPVYNLFSDLVTEYAGFKNAKQESVKAAYDPKVEAFLRSYIGEVDGETDSNRKSALQNMRVADMTMEDLWKLHNAYTMVLHSVREANKFFVKGMTETIEQLVDGIASDFKSRKIPEGKVAVVARNLINKIGWNYEKLYYALDRIGSEKFTRLIMNLANSENIVMQDVQEAVAFRDQIVKKYGFNNWDVNKKIDKEFLDNAGKKFTMTLGQMMSLYAYSRREGAWDHIEYGGFVFGEKELTNPKPADSYKLSKKQCEAITDALTKEQKAYVEDMQKFLSETMGAKGNEVSMRLYGIEMFHEKNYFPIHIAGQFKAQAQESQAKAAAGFGSMSNAGFTHAQNPNAKAPFVLEGFNEVWSDHVNEMSRYHGTVPALEDIRRVMNRSYYSDSASDSMSIKQVMENSFGKEAVDYFDNLYREANSGAITDKMQGASKKWLSKFRKNSVAYSLSVLIQQPASLVRAYAVIDKKYFGFKGFGALPAGVAKAVTSKWTHAYNDAYAEMLKYAPGVTLAKEIGGFDTASGNSIRSYLMDTGKGFAQKMKTETVSGKGQAVLDLVDNNPVANLPNVADKIAWIEIWNACKRETLANNTKLSPKSEEFMQKVGQRFTEVIQATQVYDSIFAKSPMLKSKNLAVQYLVSFMNEPNTVANMVESGARALSNGDVKKAAKMVTVVVRSIVFTGVLKSIIYALRDDDEDETFIEKYLASLTGSLIDDSIVFNYIPIARDVWSLAQGYDVERPDMAIVSDAISSLTNVFTNYGKDTSDMTEEELIEWDKKTTEANWKLVDSIAAGFGIPFKNIRREIDAVMDHARIAHENSGKTTWSGIKDAIEEAIADASPAFAKPDTKSSSDKLYHAIVSGDTVYANRLKDGYKDEESYHNAIRKALRENDPRIKEAAQADIDGDPSERVRIAELIIADGFSKEDVRSAIATQINKMTPSDGTTEPKKKGLYTAEDFAIEISNGDTVSAKAARSDYIETAKQNGKTQEEAEESFMSSAKSELGELYIDGKLSEKNLTKALQTYCDMEDDDIYWKIDEWDYTKKNGSSDGYGKYNEFFAAVETGRNLDSVIQRYTDHGVSVDTLSNQISTHFKPLYNDMSTYEQENIKGYILNAYEQIGVDREKGEAKIADWEFEDVHGYAYSDRAKLYKDGDLSADELRSILMDHGEMTYEEAGYQIEVYDWEAEGYKDVTMAAVRDYNEYCDWCYVPKDTYLYIRSFKNKTKNDKDANGKTINYSAMKKIMAEINAQDLTPAQKTAVARSLGWSDKNIQKYKLW